MSQQTAPQLARILRDFPSVRFAFAYGSGVFEQPGHRAGSRLLDFIFAVDNPRDWHTKNIEWNRNHYSCLATFGSRAVVANAELIGTGVHFNTGAWWGSQRIKYGVLCAQRLCSDLKHWDTCYISGRLHKPVHILQEDSTILRANEQNLNSALAAGVLLLPPRFTTQELLQAVVGLSYTGDVRMGFAEDSRKVERIVSGSYPGLCNLYIPRLKGTLFEGLVSLHEEGEQGRKCMDQGSRARLVSMLPAALLRQMAVLGRRPGRKAKLLPAQVEQLPLEEVASLVATSRRLSSVLRRALRGIVRSASIRQAVAGLPMAGAWTSATYVWAKMRKAWHARK